jgi:hypothetical protein
VIRQHYGVALAKLEVSGGKSQAFLIGPDRARGITMPYFIRDWVIRDLACHSVLRRGNRVILYIDK